jgi:hypothetical protein
MSEEESRRAEGKRQAETDLRKSIPELLAEVHAEAGRTLEPHLSGIARTAAKLASLLSVLSIQADKISKRLLFLTCAIAFLTVALVVLTALLAFRGP